MTPIDAQKSDDDRLIDRLSSIFKNKRLYRRLLKCPESSAQRLLDTFQKLLDTPNLDQHFHRDLIVAMQRISNRSGLYPACYQLEDVELPFGKVSYSGGGMADIYKGKFQGQYVALKTVRLFQSVQTEHLLKLFSKEAILWGQLSHPNVLTIFGLFYLQTQVCIVSLWMNNGRIDEYLKDNPEAPRKRLALDVAEGLLYLHDSGIVHGDLKGPNILVNDVGQACLTDFGLSSVSDANIIAWVSESSPYSKGGTTAWQAPEILEHQPDARNTTASDMYAWGCVCVEIFFNQRPFQGFPVGGIFTAIESGRLPHRRPEASSPSWTSGGLNKNIWSLMEACWDKNPSNRPTASGIVEILRMETGNTYPEKVENKPKLSPAEFRRSMSEKTEMVTVDELDRLLRDIEAGKDEPANDKPGKDEPGKGDSDLVILVIGARKSGKSTFINLLLKDQVIPVGQNNSSQQVLPYYLPTKEYPNNRVILVDTPGFDEFTCNLYETSKNICTWLAQSYWAHAKIAGIVYCHDIMQNRWENSAKMAFEMLEKLCGPIAAKKVVLLTTMWNKSMNKSPLEVREQELKESYWKNMISRGSVIRRGDLVTESAQDIIVSLLTRAKDIFDLPLRIQQELVDKNKALKDTEVGIPLSTRLKEFLDLYRKRKGNLQQEGGSRHQASETKAEVQKVVDKIKEQLKQLEEDGALSFYNL